MVEVGKATFSPAMHSPNLNSIATFGSRNLKEVCGVRWHQHGTGGLFDGAHNQQQGQAASPLKLDYGRDG